MKKVLYLDAFSGISGDMTLGALLDLGADEGAFRAALSRLPMAGEFALDVEKTVHGGVAGTDVTVRLTPHEHEHAHGEEHGHAHRGLLDILQILSESALSSAVHERASRIFRRVAEAEAAVHGVSVNAVHFHEVGAVDSIVDTIGACVLLELLGVDEVVSSPLNLGGGTVSCAHGILPVPAPATALIVKGCPTYGSDARFGELVTPTGAAIAREAASFGPQPLMRGSAVGYGFGKRDTGGLNALRAFLGVREENTLTEPVMLLEANLDDMTGEALAYAAARLLEEGALDVWLTPIYMKKGRPGQVLSCLVKPADAPRLSMRLLRETSSWGVRQTALSRQTLVREATCKETPYGPIRMKTGAGKAKPEFMDCAAIAREADIPLQTVILAAHGVTADGEGK